LARDTLTTDVPRKNSCEIRCPIAYKRGKELPMMDNPMNDAPKSPSRETRASVLSGMRRSKDQDRKDESRTRFFEMYRPSLFVYFKRRGLQDHDAEDLASDLMLSLLAAMETFHYDPSHRFRNYLARAANHALAKFWAKNAKRQVRTGVDLDQQISPEDLEERLQNEVDQDLQRKAMERVRGQVSNRDWEIFIDLTEGRAKPDDLANALGMTRRAVDTAKWRVKSRIKAEVKQIEDHGLEEA
jgi:RNA polymerase sigma factor (sigma-70 family)